MLSSSSYIPMFAADALFEIDTVIISAASWLDDQVSQTKQRLYFCTAMRVGELWFKLYNCVN